MRILIVVVFSVMALFPSLASALEMQGAAIYQRLNNDVYIASIHSGSSNSNAWLNSSAPLRLEMRILAQRLSPRRFYRLWNEGLAINLSQKQMNEQVDELTRFMYLLKDDLVEGDHVVISNETGKTRVSVNEVELLVVDKPKMVKSLLNVWIGKYPRSQQFKERLINMSASDRSAMNTRLTNMTFQPDRVAVIEGWIKPSTKKQEENVAVVAVSDDEQGVDLAVAAVGVTTAVSQQAAIANIPDTAKGAGLATGDASSNKEGDSTASDEQTGPTEEELEAQRLAAEAAAREAAEEAERERQEQMLRIERQLAESSYYRDMLNQANSKVKYPRSALKRKLQGVTRVNIVLNRNGSVKLAQVLESSEHNVLDKAALKAAEAAAPYPVLPHILEGEEFEFDVPFRFVMRAQ